MKALKSEKEHSDAYDDIIDVETGEKVEDTTKGSPTGYLIGWAEERMGITFPNKGKQAKMISKLVSAGFSVEKIQECWERLENDPFWAEKGIDFGIVFSQIAKMRPQQKIPSFKSIR